jgi:2-polyprenyl-3-methyl-5-hydroxy-6-metoxy-1,4-benzoquinol methylase
MNMLFFLISISFFCTCVHASRVALFGADGYQGSHLFNHLVSLGKEVTPYPPFVDHFIVDSDLHTYDTVIFLGGLNSSEACNSVSQEELYKVNVEDVASLAIRMKPTQLLIFGSTGFLGVNSGTNPMNEEKPIKTELLDHYETSLAKREARLRTLSKELGPSSFPRAIGIRAAIFEPFKHLICSAFTAGHIAVINPERIVSALSLEDYSGAIASIIAAAPTLSHFDIFNLQSIWGTEDVIANEVAFRTGIKRSSKPQPFDPSLIGSTLSTKRITAATGFEFKGTLSTVITNVLDHLPSLCAGHPTQAKEAPPCVICGSHDMMPVLDLSSQPLANDFFNSTAAALSCETYPLAIARCRHCQHTQLTHFVDRARLFRDYRYVSGTSTTGRDYFAWMAQKVIAEVGAQTPSKLARGSVLDIACNDGSQLNPFRASGWDTYCVDPAANLAPIARAAGHNVQVAFWGVDPVVLPPLDAIIAQNVLAHVLNPMDFVRACADVMGPTTRLYLQTSQCEMYDSGQFDTIYHEHVSFFSAHSFERMAELAGLKIVNFEKTPIHGVSCLVTLMKRGEDSITAAALSSDLVPTLSEALSKEVEQGLTSDFFYHRYRGQAYNMRAWMHSTLTKLSEAGYELAGYGAAAKGMVLLHFLLSIPGRKWDLSFVVDESWHKQGTYCPGTVIPVVPQSALLTRNVSRPLAVIVLPWNFGDEILRKVASSIRESNLAVKSVVAVVPFPKQQLLRLDIASGSTTLLLKNPDTIPVWPITPPSSSLVSTFAVLLINNVRSCTTA